MSNCLGITRGLLITVMFSVMALSQVERLIIQHHTPGQHALNSSLDWLLSYASHHFVCNTINCHSWDKKTLTPELPYNCSSGQRTCQEQKNDSWVLAQFLPTIAAGTGIRRQDRTSRSFGEPLRSHQGGVVMQARLSWLCQPVQLHFCWTITPFVQAAHPRPHTLAW